MVLCIRQIGELPDDESSLVDFTDFEEDTKGVVELIHNMALSELFSRSIVSMWDWEPRTKHMFVNNHLHRIEDVTLLTPGRVNRLMGCGYQTRKEVYEVFCLYHVRLIHWEPREMNYKF